MLIFAHRGLKLEQPENTLEAFGAAAVAQFGIECDVRITKDKDLICIHDRNPERTSGYSEIRDVHEHTVAELQSLHVGNICWQWQKPARIPRFLDVAAQVIAGFDGAYQRAAIHVKTEEQGDRQFAILAQAFSRYDLYNKAFLFDLTLESAARMRAIDPKIQIFISVGEKRYAPSIHMWDDLKDHGSLYDGVWWDEWSIAGAAYTHARAEEIKKTGKLIYAISPELHLDHRHPHALMGYYQEWERFISWGVDGVCTAFPRAFRDFLSTAIDT